MDICGGRHGANPTSHLPSYTSKLPAEILSIYPISRFQLDASRLSSPSIVIDMSEVDGIGQDTTAQKATKS
ncbi:uncharacterized protein BDCG_16391 [Blastomyces dermatitidis ER-3]|uniref:Uncharacterized protein n=3 Tax=Blastomyces TaxID=229219 RepID=A0A179ULN2_BLAGS|nr:uncharacterized protein BDBG_17141 [Blastomyces gilchristii SLH14081]XP_045279668.1 uncharacterized protein BDCG_16391 [Blastomyces dermatitidis ER-3]EQL37224.1 hypothetical protein BDFG_01485 [Blastomyces dermatitidis ATCC 26199]KMW66906.1 hypothetical protein BDDG_11783 [Blastomyces dermatitidis ATCC 18188]OAS99940.1 hypothetical protein BDCG_16391 [Blastomyces dermatitidis ER-3]OAT08976.1 hypothetical protein BDBG_17141 [Blastomyces gilchristii SLH14081]